jgi:hypothetical protein
MLSYVQPVFHLFHPISEHLGDRLAEILHKEGSFGAKEVKVKQVVSQEETDKTLGGWHTEISLEKLGWKEPQP